MKPIDKPDAPRRREPSIPTPYEIARPTEAMPPLQLDVLMRELAGSKIDDLEPEISVCEERSVESDPPVVAPARIAEPVAEPVAVKQPSSARWSLLVGVAMGAIVIAEFVRVFVLRI
jgi:hypothetical protein